MLWSNGTIIQELSAFTSINYTWWGKNSNMGNISCSANFICNFGQAPARIHWKESCQASYAQNYFTHVAWGGNCWIIKMSQYIKVTQRSLYMSRWHIRVYVSMAQQRKIKQKKNGNEMQINLWDFESVKAGEKQIKLISKFKLQNKRQLFKIYNEKKR